MPDTIDGCGEFFTYDTTQLANDRYIFLCNLTDFAIIRIKGKEFYLKIDSTESDQTNDKSYIALYKGHGYKVILSIERVKTYDEGGLYTGTLSILGEKMRRTFKVQGEAGC